MRKVNFAEGEYYHLYNRGVDKRTIFSSSVEYNRFLGYLYLLNTQDSIRSEAVFSGRKHNKKQKRSGSLFGGTYKAQHVDKDEYLKYLFSYIHLNPAKLFDSRWKEEGAKNLKKLKRQVMEYPYSSIYDYISSNFTIINPRYFPNYFEKSADFESQILFWLSFKDKKK